MSGSAARLSPAELAESMGMRLGAELRPGAVLAVPGLPPTRAVHPVADALALLLPTGGPSDQLGIDARRRGATTFLFALLAAATAKGLWSAIVDEPRLYPLSAVAARASTSNASPWSKPQASRVGLPRSARSARASRFWSPRHGGSPLANFSARPRALPGPVPQSSGWRTSPHRDSKPGWPSPLASGSACGRMRTVGGAQGDSIRAGSTSLPPGAGAGARVRSCGPTAVDLHRDSWRAYSRSKSRRQFGERRRPSSTST